MGDRQSPGTPHPALAAGVPAACCPCPPLLAAVAPLFISSNGCLLSFPAGLHMPRWWPCPQRSLPYPASTDGSGMCQSTSRLGSPGRRGLQAPGLVPAPSAVPMGAQGGDECQGCGAALEMDSGASVSGCKAMVGQDRMPSLPQGMGVHCAGQESLPRH